LPLSFLKVKSYNSFLPDEFWLKALKFEFRLENFEAFFQSNKIIWNLVSFAYFLLSHNLFVNRIFHPSTLQVIFLYLLSFNICHLDWIPNVPFIYSMSKNDWWQKGLEYFIKFSTLFVGDKNIENMSYKMVFFAICFCLLLPFSKR